MFTTIIPFPYCHLNIPNHSMLQKIGSTSLVHCSKHTHNKPIKVTYLKDAFQSLALLLTTDHTHFSHHDLYSLILDLCTSHKSLSQGKQIHANVIKSYALSHSVFLNTKLVHMYGKCGSFLEAEKVFDEMPERTIFTWNAMLGAYVTEGKNMKALALYKEMRLLGVSLDAHTFACVLKACGALNELRLGVEIHGMAIKCGYGTFVFVSNALISMYAKCNDLNGARLLFDNMQWKDDIVSWNSIIVAHVMQGHFSDALMLFRRMQGIGVASNSYTLVAILQACEDPAFIKLGMEMHAGILKSDYYADSYVANALISMYAKCGRMEEAERVFVSMNSKDYISWNTLLSGFVQNDLYNEVLNYFREMWYSGQKPDQVSLLNVIAASGRSGKLLCGMEAHAYAIRKGMDSDMQIGNTLVYMYAKCCCVKYMGGVFENMHERDLITWTTIIAGYSQNGCHLDALDLFRMVLVERINIDVMMIGSILTACSGLKSKISIKEIHGYIMKRDLADTLLQNSIVNAYGETGELDYAKRMFEAIKSKCIVSWTSMLSSYIHNGLAIEALELFCSLKETKLQIDSVALVSLLSAVASLSALKKGKEIHGFLIRKGFQLKGSIASSLVNMYASCGSLGDSEKLFKYVKKRDIILWTSMINAYGVHGLGTLAITLFNKMIRENIIPDHITFLALLHACSHSRLMDEGRRLFVMMKHEYQLEPWPDHYACLVDLLGRSNCLEEAYHIVKNMPIKPTAEVWCALLAACRIHSNEELGELAAEQLLQLDTKNSGNYALISNILASNERWDIVQEVRMRMKRNGLKKQPGCSWIEVGNEVHTFMARDKAHPNTNEIYLKLAQFTKLLENEVGYRPETKYVMDNVDEDDKIQMLYGHSERLALGYGLTATPEGTSLRITKNLRICNDCHTFFKLASKVSKRILIVRDANRFHHFRNGACSCGDFW